MQRRTMKAGAGGKNPLKLPGQTGKQTEVKQVQASDPTTQSMQITHDRRYEEIEHYQQAGLARLERIVGSDGSPNRLYPEQWKFPEPIGTRAALTRVPVTTEKAAAGGISIDPSEVGAPPEEPETLQLDPELEFQALANREVQAGSAGNRTEKFAGRVNWETSFRSNMTSLMVDFNLTTDPGCRLHHLDRLHNWFTKEGRKQTRKEKPAPNFLTFENHLAPLPGSARSIAPPSSIETCNLACTLQMQNRCPRIVPHLGENPPPPPQPGYK